MKIKILGIGLIALLFFACHTASHKTPVKHENKSIGGNKDAHGCSTSAGYTWSQLQQKCIRIFEEGTALLEVRTNNSYEQAAYIWLDKDHKKAEIFLPDTKKSIILLQSDQNKQIYTFKRYKLSKQDDKWILYIKNNKAYEEK